MGTELVAADGVTPLRQLMAREIAAPAMASQRSIISGNPAAGLDPERLASILRGADDGNVIDYLELAEQIDRAVRDSTRYAKVLDARRKLTAERDSVNRQLQIIRTIDENRYNWAHILDEISRALPAYTWLTTLEQTSKAPLPPGAETLDGVSTPQPAAAAAKAKKSAVVRDTIDVHPMLSFRVVGQTVDIQALTMFMRQLESSPFIQHVALTKSEIVLVEGKDVTQFELAADYEVPPPGVVRTSPLIVPVR
jgi:Tfp pilus assembly protein PilN